MSRVGQRVSFKYRGGGGEGRVVGIYKQSMKDETTGYKIKPDAKYRHPGEPELIHRLGAHLRKI